MLCRIRLLILGVAVPGAGGSKVGRHNILGRVRGRLILGRILGRRVHCHHTLGRIVGHGRLVESRLFTLATTVAIITVAVITTVVTITTVDTLHIKTTAAPTILVTIAVRIIHRTKSRLLQRRLLKKIT
jgi:hypothetical protein